MSIADKFSFSSLYDDGWDESPPAPLPPAPETSELHRIAEVRQEQGVSVRSAARRMNVPLDEVRRQEKPDADLRLSELHRWQQALDVPVSDLLVEQSSPLSAPVLGRARLLRLMKTARAIREAASDPAIDRMGKMLEQQLLEIMPELDEVSAWHSVGQRRTQDEVGRVAERPISDNFARDALE